MSPRRIYLDYAASTPLDSRVRAALRPCVEETFGNPSSLHAEGRARRTAVEQARTHVAGLVHAAPENVIFTGGGTEADNLALTGVVNALGNGPIHLISSVIEHPAVLETCRALASRDNVHVTLVGVDADGSVRPDALRAALRSDTRLVSIMAANNVTGVVQPTAALAAVAHAHGCLFHTDAVEAGGTLPLDMERDGIDLLSLSRHKLYGPQGAGALVVRGRDQLAPLLHGGGQERGLRPGTENVAALVGFGEAARLAALERADETIRLVELRDRLNGAISRTVPGAYLIGHAFRRLPGHVCVGLAGLEGESIMLMLALDEAGFAVSTGSACSARQASSPAYVLQAMGFDALRARGALRITLGRFTRSEEVDEFLDALPAIVARLRPITQRAVRPAGVTP